MQSMQRAPNRHGVFMCDVSSGTSKTEVDPQRGQHLLFGNTGSLRDFARGVVLPCQG